MNDSDLKIVILSRTNKFSWEFLKYSLNDILKRQRGPKAVEQSLVRGLKEKGIAFELNPRKISENSVVHVLSGKKALQEAIDLKKSGKIKTLVVGPNFEVIPPEKYPEISDPNIDAIVFPCQWIKDFYLSLNPALASKIFVWPSGVKDPGEQDKIEKEIDFLIYVKNDPQNIFPEIQKILKTKGYSNQTIFYGKYKPQYFFEMLEKSRAVIFLSKSETQGIALQEAWIRNVPTLVWNPKSYQDEKNSWQDEKISAPYLTFESGEFFSDAGEFSEKVEKFYTNTSNFSPRNYCLRELSDDASIQKWLDIIKQNV